jgi:hypothetical protein
MASRKPEEHYHLINDSRVFGKTVGRHLFGGAAPFSGMGVRLVPLKEGATGAHAEQSDTPWLVTTL